MKLKILISFLKKSIIVNKLRKQLALLIKIFEGQNKQIKKQLHEYNMATDDYLSSKVESLSNINDLANRFENLGLKVVRLKIDIQDFERWLNEFKEIMDFYKDYKDVSIEKPLEHYLTMKYLNISKKDIYIDIAACASPFAEIVEKNVGSKSFIQDLIFKKGINGNKIGGDAGDMPVPDNFADVMTLHCAYECFRGDSDIRFIKEAGRVLKTGGRLGIVPLYIDDVYFVKTGPKCDKRKIKVESEARWIWRDDQYDSGPFSRHYSPESFKNRIIDNIVGMNCELLFFTNLDELSDRYEGQKIYCNFMFRVLK